MSVFKRIKEIIKALIIAFFGIILIFAGEKGQLIVVAIIFFYLLFDGIRLLIYYLRMARHMVEGKKVLVRSIITLDLGLITLQMVSMSNITILIFLLSIFAFTGAIDILRSREAKRNGGHWRIKLINGCIYIIFSIALIIAGLFVKNTYFLVCGFSISFFYSAFFRVFSALRKTAIVYIQ